MVIIFSSEKARNYLLEHGVVYTARLKKRTQVGKDWMTDRRGGSKICDVFITLKGWTIGFGLEPYLEQSGFSSLSEWWTELVNINKVGARIRGKLYIYKVEVQK